MSHAEAFLSSESVSSPVPAEVIAFPVPFNVDELRLLADCFAREFGYDEHVAFVHGDGWYRNSVEAERCSPERARVLRHMTIHECQAKAAERLDRARGFAMYAPAGEDDAAIGRVHGRVFASLPRVERGIVELRPWQRRAAFHLVAFSLGSLLVLACLLAGMAAR